MADRNTGEVSYGVDIGGSKIELVACDAALRIQHRQRIDTPRDGYDDFLDAVCALVAEADAALGGGACGGIGIGLPGVRDRASGRQLSANVPALTGRQVGGDLQARLQRPLHLGNEVAHREHALAGPRHQGVGGNEDLLPARRWHGHGYASPPGTADGGAPATAAAWSWARETWYSTTFSVGTTK